MEGVLRPPKEELMLSHKEKFERAAVALMVFGGFVFVCFWASRNTLPTQESMAPVYAEWERQGVPHGR